MPNLSLTDIGGGKSNGLMFRMAGSTSALLVDCGRTASEQDFRSGVLPFPDPGILGVISEANIYARIKPYLGRTGITAIRHYISHCHLDHSGSDRVLRYLARELGYETWSSLFTAEVMGTRDYYDVDELFEVHYYEGEVPSEFGEFRITPHQVCHSTACAFILEIETPMGVIISMMDFTFQRYDDKQVVYTERLLGGLGQKKPLAVIVESIYADRPGETLTPQETVVTEAYHGILAEAEARGRRVIATFFGSNVNRTSELLCLAHDMGQKRTRLLGAPRQYYEDAKAAGGLGLGALERKLNIDASLEEADFLIASGCQAEPGSVLDRAVNADRILSSSRGSYLALGEEDTVVMSAIPIPIPGQEDRVLNLVEKILEQGAEVVVPTEWRELYRHRVLQYPRLRFDRVHVSGHESWYGLKRTLEELVKPKYVIPYHGEQWQRERVAQKVVQELPGIGVLMLNEGATITL